MRALVVGICLLIAAPAVAQSTAIGVNATWDIARFSKVEVDNRVLAGIAPNTMDGEALGFAVNVRQAIGENWGVSFEFSRSGEIETRTSRPFGPIPFPAGTAIPGVAGTIIRPDLQVEFRSEQRHLGYGALAWVRHEVGERVKLSYLGGVGFVHSEVQRDFGIDPRVLAALIARSELSTIEVNVGPLVGADADFELTDHTAFTAGVRLQGVNVSGQKGWLIRPGVGVRWTF